MAPDRANCRRQAVLRAQLPTPRSGRAASTSQPTAHPSRTSRPSAKQRPGRSPSEGRGAAKLHADAEGGIELGVGVEPNADRSAARAAIAGYGAALEQRSLMIWPHGHRGRVRRRRPGAHTRASGAAGRCHRDGASGTIAGAVVHQELLGVDLGLPSPILRRPIRQVPVCTYHRASVVVAATRQLVADLGTLIVIADTRRPSC